MKGLLPVVVFGGVVVGAAENESMKYRPTFMSHEVSTLTISTELHASDSTALQVSLVINSLSLSLFPLSPLPLHIERERERESFVLDTLPFSGAFHWTDCAHLAQRIGR